MNKIIPLKAFIVMQILFMFNIAIIYLALIYPQIKPWCTKSNECSMTTHCDCSDNVCDCEYLDENENVVKIKCPKS